MGFGYLEMTGTEGRLRTQGKKYECHLSVFAAKGSRTGLSPHTACLFVGHTAWGRFFSVRHVCRVEIRTRGPNWNFVPRVRRLGKYCVEHLLTRGV